MRALVPSVVFCALAAATACDLDQRQLNGAAPAACEGSECAEGDAEGPATSAAGTGGAGGSTVEQGGSGAGGSAASPAAGGSGAPGAGGSEVATGSGGSTPSGAGGTGEPLPAPGMDDGPSCATELLANGSFESGVAPWAEFAPGEPVISSEALSANEGTRAKTGEFLAWFGGVADETTRVSQTFTVPEGTLALVLSGYRRFISKETQPANFVDRMTIRFVRGLDTVLELEEWGNQDAAPDAEWELFSQRIPAEPYVGQALTLQLESSIGPAPDSNFFFDDLSLSAECTP
jgi:hypothetical protein